MTIIDTLVLQESTIAAVLPRPTFFLVSVFFSWMNHVFGFGFVAFYVNNQHAVCGNLSSIASDLWDIPPFFMYTCSRRVRLVYSTTYRPTTSGARRLAVLQCWLVQPAVVVQVAISLVFTLAIFCLALMKLLKPFVLPYWNFFWNISCVRWTPVGTIRLSGPNLEQ